MKNISIIVAISENFAIGKDNRLLWHIPDDLKRVKTLTSGNVIVMGRNTYFSLPKRPLPDRINLVISDNKNDRFDGCLMAYSFEEAMEKMSSSKENFIFGGSSVYRQFYPVANKLYLTLVHKYFEADTFFPEIDFSEWNETERKDMPFNEGLGFSYSYITYIRKY
ncbi:MAG: dihydrofolate reductase [Bacteroidales bacterium]|nr:dihydrofolate reductase [Bacteroidales bacterium]